MISFQTIVTTIANGWNSFGHRVVGICRGWGIDDWVILAIVTAAWIVSTVFLFKHPDPTNFATWAAFGATEVSAYHWLSINDDKRPDSGDDK